MKNSCFVMFILLLAGYYPQAVQAQVRYKGGAITAHVPAGISTAGIACVPCAGT